MTSGKEVLVPQKVDPKVRWFPALFFSPKTYLASAKWVLGALVLQRGHLLLPPVSSQLPKPEQFESILVNSSLDPKGRDSF